MRRTSLVCLLSVLLFSAASAQDYAAIEFARQELAPGVWMVSRGGGNQLLVEGPESVLMVDAAVAPLSDKLLAAVAEWTGKPVERVVNTHWHFDHTGGNGALRAAGAVVTAHARVADRMAAGQTLTIIDHVQPPAEPGELPTDLVTGSTERDFHGRAYRLLHFPHAHTDGDLAVHLPDVDVLQTGDLVFFGGYPFIDVSSGGSIDGVIDAVAALIELCGPATQVVPGHGPLTDRAGLTTYLGMLQEFRAGVAGAVADGADLEAVLASDCTAGLDAVYGDKIFPPAMFREMVFRSLPASD